MLPIYRRLAVLALACALTIGSFPGLSPIAAAAEFVAFEVAKFQDAQAQGRPIVVDIAATWCPTCKAQKPIIQSLAADPTYKDLIIFQVNFDDQKNVVRSLGAQLQSTLIAYRGKAETGRSVGDTNPSSIAALFQSTLKN